MKTVDELAKIAGGKVAGNAKDKIEGITNIDNPAKGYITFVNKASDIKRLESTEISCVIAPPDAESGKITLILCEQPKLAWAKLLGLFHPPQEFETKVSEKAFVHDSAVIGENVAVEAGAHVSKNAKIGKGTVIRGGAYIDENVEIGEDCVIHPNAMIYRDSKIGNRVIIHAGAAVGSDGFGYVIDKSGNQVKVPQVGNVIIEDDVEIGANAAIDRATLGSTVIKKGAKIDNLVQIAHNVYFGENSVASAQTGISGSSKIGVNTILAGQVGIGDHCEIGDQVIVGAQSGVATNKKIPPKSIVFGYPARPLREMKKQFAAQQRAAETRKDVEDLKKKMAELEEKVADL